MAECKGSFELGISGVSSGWRLTEHEAKAVVRHKIHEQGLQHLKCDGSCKDEDEQCKLISELLSKIKIKYAWLIVDNPPSNMLPIYKAVFKGKVKFTCECVPKDVH